jgi:integrase
VPRFHEDNARKGFFEREEFRLVLAELPEYLRGVFEVAYITGWRVASEILTRQWAHVDFKAGWLRLDPGETKNGEGRMFPLTPDLRAALARQRAYTDDVQRATGRIIPAVFNRAGEPIKDFRRAWRGAVKRAGLTVTVERNGKKIVKPARIPHDFRRTAIRNLERAGIPRSAAMKMVGHRTEAIYRRYAIADEGMLREAGAKLAALHEADREAPATVIALHARQ